MKCIVRAEVIPWGDGEAWGVLYQYDRGWSVHQIGSFYEARLSLLPPGTFVEDTEEKRIARKHPKRLQ